MGGVIVEIWHHGRGDYDEVRWFPNLFLSRSEARAWAFRVLMEDVESTRVEVRFDENGAEVATPSARRINRLSNAWERRELLEPLIA